MKNPRKYVVGCTGNKYKKESCYFVGTFDELMAISDNTIMYYHCPQCNARSPVDVYKYDPSDLRGLSAITHDIHFQRLRRTEESGEHTAKGNLCCFRLILSGEDNITPNQIERFWTALQTIKHPVSFEVVGDGSANTILFQFFCREDDKELVVNQLTSLFPNSSINPEGNDKDWVAEKIGEGYEEKLASEFHGFGASLGLSNHYSYQLRRLTSYDRTDPFGGVINALGNLGKGEYAIVQALISPLRNWDTHLDVMSELPKEDKENLSGVKGLPFTQKRRYPLFAVCYRVMAFGNVEETDMERLETMFGSIERALVSYRAPDGNGLTSYPDDIIERDDLLPIPKSYQQVKSGLDKDEVMSIFARQTHRHGFILNTQELASLCHFPHPALEHPKLLRQDSMFVKAPESMTTGQGLRLGINEVFGESQEVYIPEDFRFRHLYVVGKTGTGKTTFLYNLIKNDIDAGKGVALIDPHGDLVEQVLRNIPEHRIDDVILFDPADTEYPIGFNMFQVNNSLERRQMRTDILVAIRRLFDDASWGDNIDQIFRTSIATLLADTKHTHTLADVRRLVTDEVFRSKVVGRIDDEFIKEFWREDFPDFTRLTTSAVRRRLGSVLSEPEVRNVLTQKETGFNFKEMMDTKKIFLAKLSRGTLGEDISRLFGGLLVSKIQLTVMARESQPEAERVPFYLYVDEFQNFVSEGFEIILSEARKYRLSLTMAHQFTAQLPRNLYNAVFGNVGSLVIFETGVDDASALEKQLGKFSKEDIMNLESFHTITRVGKAKEAFSMRTLPPFEEATDRSAEARKASREKYGSNPQSLKADSPTPEPEEAEQPPQPEPDPAPVQEPVSAEADEPTETPEPVETEKKGEKKLDFFE